MINGLALYTGNGGLEAALHLVLPGYRTVCAVERQAYAAAAFVEWLEKARLGACPVWDDATTFDPLPWRGLVDIVSAGFPCQPYSGAGKGLRESDPRDGWPHVFRTVRALMPPIFWGENVATIITMGRHSFKSDLESLGYRVAAGIYSAAEVGAPHLRERLFILGTLADSARVGRPEPEGQQGRSHASFSGSGLGDADCLRRDRRPDVTGGDRKGELLLAGQAMWATPTTAQNGPDYARSARKGSGTDDLVTQAAKWGTPTARDWKGSGMSAQLPTDVINGRGPQGAEPNNTHGKSPGSLNPDWVEQLMGWAPGMSNFSASATEWSRWLALWRSFLFGKN